MTRRTLRLSIVPASWRTLGTALALVAALLVGTIPAPALAHHGWSGYDSATLLTLTGTIVDVQYENPHVMVTLAIPQTEEAEVEHEEGEVHEDVEAKIQDPPTLTVVMAPPFRSENRGLARDMLVPGATVTYEGYLHKSNTLELRAERIIIGDLTVELR